MAKGAFRPKARIAGITNNGRCTNYLGQAQERVVLPAGPTALTESHKTDTWAARVAPNWQSDSDFSRLES